MNKLLNNLLGMYKQAKLNKKAEEVVYDSDLIAQVLSMTKNQKEDEFSIATLSPEKDKVLGVKYIKKAEVYDYKPNQNEYALVMTRDTGFADTDYQLQPMIMVVRSWNEGRKFYATKKNQLNKKAEEDLIEVGWGLENSDEDMIKSIAEDAGRKINKNFWNKINKDIDRVESWFLTKGYKNFFTKVRDEGHGKYNELGGTAWMTKQQLEDYISQAEKYDENSYMLLENEGSLYIDINHDDALEFHLFIYVDDKDLNELGIESKRVSKNKKQSSKNTKLTKKANYTEEEMVEMKEIAPQLKYIHKYEDIPTYLNPLGVFEKNISFEEALKLAGDDLWDAIWRALGHLYGSVELDNGDKITVDGYDYRKKYSKNRRKTSHKKQLSKKAMRKKAFRKLCLKRAFHKTAGEFEEMMKLKSTDPKLISYLAKEFGVEESTVSQYTDVSENAEELYNILEEQANKYGYEWDKFEYDEYGDRIDEDDFRGNPDDLEKAVEYLKNNIDKSMFKFEYVGTYEENYLTFSVNEKLIPIEKPIIYITNDTKNYDISFFVQSQKSKEEDKAEGIESNDHLTILLRRTSDEILNEIVNYVNVELPKKIEEQNKKKSSKNSIKAEKNNNLFNSKYKTKIEILDKKYNEIQTKVKELNDKLQKTNDFEEGEKILKEIETLAQQRDKIGEEQNQLYAEWYKEKTKQEKQSSKAKLVRKQAKYEETVQGDEKVKDSAKSFGYDIKFAGHYGRWIYYYLIDEKGNIIRDDKEYQKVYDEMKKRIDDDIDIDNYAFAKGLIEEVDGKLMRVPTIVVSEGSLLINHKDRKQASTKKKAGIDPNVLAEDILKLNFDMPIEKADKVKEQLNEKGIKYQSRKGKYTVEFSVDIEAGKVDLVYEIIRNIKKSSSTKKQATIKHENGVYNVYSESGKCLGKGYKTKEEAEKRLKQVEYFKNKKAKKQKTYEEWGVLCNDLVEEWFESEEDAKEFFYEVKNKVDQVVHKVYDISNEEPEEIEVDVLYDKDRKINKLTMRTSLKQLVISKMAKIKK